MKDEKENIKLDKPLSKENARTKYKKLSPEEKEQASNKFEDLVEAKIQKAIADGEFKNLRGKGKPIDLGRYYSMPGHLRLGYQILKNAGYIPEEVRLKKEIEVIKEKIRKTKSENKKNKLLKELSDISQQFNFYMEYNKKFK
ncbi:MAG: DUF1992 domain-containing protein [Deltaproteobacteria bacterium]|nr:DUF1992 domain-containing protein [Deltaproteobacteria bacterium]MBW2180471.1 DUF1992 domain-containing protein [Deltaproteobacteria bacterium]